MGPRLRGGDGKYRGGDGKYRGGDGKYRGGGRNEHPSFPRRRESIVPAGEWTPAFAGVTASGALVLPVLLAHLLAAGTVLFHHRALLV